MNKRDDRRRQPRQFSAYCLKIMDADSGNTFGHLVDMTTDGLMVKSDQPIREHSLHQLTMELPDEVGEAETVEFVAYSKWCRNAPELPIYDIGLEFRDASAQSQRIMEYLIRHHSF